MFYDNAIESGGLEIVITGDGKQFCL